MSSGLSAILEFSTGDVCAMTEIVAMCVIATIMLNTAPEDADFTSEQKRTCMGGIFNALALPGNRDYGRAQE